MPVINERFTAIVRDISSEGNGIVEHPCGQIFFVPGVWVGEKAEFTITGFKKRFGFAEVKNLLEPSVDRITPDCRHHGFGSNSCGGCPWQFISYPAQLEAKQRRVEQTLDWLGIEPCIKPIWGSTKLFGYRNRAQLKTDGEHLGFVAQGSNNLVAIEDCPILTEPNRITLKALLATLPNAMFKPPRKSLWNTIEIDEQMSANQVVVNERRPFQQGNAEQNQRMRHWLVESLADCDKSSPVLELFAGSGNFTKPLVDVGFQQILAVDAAVEAQQVLDENQWQTVSTQVANLFTQQGVKQVIRAMPKAKLLVFDPPRDGFPELSSLLKGCKKICDVRYISCNPATFARDLEVMIKHGFLVEEIQPLDQFPHTPHIELMARLYRS